MEKTIAYIARQYFSIRVLENQNNDRLDFHEVAVWQVKDALEAAYKAGLEAGKAK